MLQIKGLSKKFGKKLETTFIRIKLTQESLEKLVEKISSWFIQVLM